MTEKTGPSHDPARPRRAATVAILAGAALLVAACGGGSHPAGSGASSPPNLAAAVNSFAQCLRTHGEPNVYVSDAPSRPNVNTTVMILNGLAVLGANPALPQVQAAMNACQHLLPHGAPETAAQLHQQFLQALKSATCMRAHGYPDWPDPRIVKGQVGIPFPIGIDTGSPQFQSAAKRCGEPTGFPGG
jgi:hypothetical protein